MWINYDLINAQRERNHYITHFRGDNTFTLYVNNTKLGTDDRLNVSQFIRLQRIVPNNVQIIMEREF